LAWCSRKRIIDGHFNTVAETITTNTNPRFEVNVGTAVNKKARDGRVTVVGRYVQGRKTALKHTHAIIITITNVNLARGRIAVEKFGQTPFLAPSQCFTESTEKVQNWVMRPHHLYDWRLIMAATTRLQRMRAIVGRLLNKV